MIQSFTKGPYGIEEGGFYRRAAGGSMIEIAEVVDISADRMGIPHVRFNLHLMRGNYAAAPAEQRTLSLESFSGRFKEKIQTAT